MLFSYGFIFVTILAATLLEISKGSCRIKDRVTFGQKTANFCFTGIAIFNTKFIFGHLIASPFTN
jgi:hypothetical protein